MQEKGREKKETGGRQGLKIIMDKGQSQTRSNSTVSNTFSSNQTRTPSSAGEKAHSQKQFRDSRRLRHQSSQNSCRYLRIFGQVHHIIERKVAFKELHITSKQWIPFTLTINSWKTELQKANIKYFACVLSYWLDKTAKLMNSDKFLLLRSAEPQDFTSSIFGSFLLSCLLSHPWTPCKLLYLLLLSVYNWHKLYFLLLLLLHSTDKHQQSSVGTSDRKRKEMLRVELHWQKHMYHWTQNIRRRYK